MRDEGEGRGGDRKEGEKRERWEKKEKGSGDQREGRGEVDGR